MSDLYIELLVKKKKTSTDTLLKVLMIAATVILVLVGLMFVKPIILIAAVGMGILDYFKMPALDLEYEYLYVNGELDIDKIMSKQKRKRVGTYDMKNVELVAPKKSHELDSVRNMKDIKVHDYSSMDENAKTFGMLVKGDKNKELVYFDPSPEILKDMQRIAPRSVKLY